MQEQAEGRDVGDRVHSPHFMEVDLFDRPSVGMTLGLRDQLIDLHDVTADRFRNVQMVHNAPDIGEIPVHMVVAVMMVVVVSLVMPVIVTMTMMMVMLMTMSIMFIMMVVVLMHMFRRILLLVIMIMFMFRAVMHMRMCVIVIMFMIIIMAVRVTVHVVALLFLPPDPDRQVGAADAAFVHRLSLIGHARDPQGVQAADHAGGIRMELQQSGGKHVSGSPHIAGKIQCFHRFFPPLVPII